MIQKLLDLGAKRSLKTKSGKTAFDIARAITVPREEEVLDLLQVPAEVTDNREMIDRMEKALHEKGAIIYFVHTLWGMAEKETRRLSEGGCVTGIRG